MENKAHALAAGAFVLAISALLVALAAWLTRDTGVHRLFELSTKDAVTGLQPQAPVRFRGVLVGKVTNIGFDPQTLGNVLVRVSIDDSVPITRSTFASLGFLGVTGLAFVALDDSGESREMLKGQGEQAPRIPLRASLLSTLTDQGANLLAQLEENSKRINLLLAPANQKALFGAVTQLGQAAGSVQQLALNMDRVLDAQLGPQNVNIPLLVQQTGATMQSVKHSAEQIGKSTEDVRVVVTEFKRLSERINGGGGTLDKLAAGVDALAGAGQTLNTTTLPRLNRTADDTARAARLTSRAVGELSDNPQSLLYGNGAVPPGPGEAGFSLQGGKP